METTAKMKTQQLNYKNYCKEKKRHNQHIDGLIATKEPDC